MNATDLYDPAQATTAERILLDDISGTCPQPPQGMWARLHALEASQNHNQVVNLTNWVPAAVVDEPQVTPGGFDFDNATSEREAGARAPPAPFQTPVRSQESIDSAARAWQAFADAEATKRAREIESGKDSDPDIGEVLLRTLRAASQFPELTRELKTEWRVIAESGKLDPTQSSFLKAASVIASKGEQVSDEALLDTMTVAGVTIGAQETAHPITLTEVTQYLGDSLVVSTTQAAREQCQRWIRNYKQNRLQAEIRQLDIDVKLPPEDYVLELKKLTAKLMAAGQTSVRVDPGIRTGQQLVKEFPKRGEVLVDGFLRRKMPAMLVSDSKVGKTTLIHTLAASMAKGEEWLGFKVMRPLKVLLIDCELDEAELAHKVKNARELGELPPELDYDLWAVAEFDYDMNTLCDQLEATVKHGTYDAILIDCMGPLIPKDKDENSNSDMGPLMRRASQTSIKLDCCLVGVHHASKGDQNTKKTIDVGAGAGSWSRYCGTWLVISPKTQEPDEEQFLARGVARGFKPIKQFGLRRIVDEVRGMVRFEVDENIQPNGAQTGDKLAAAAKNFMDNFVPCGEPISQDKIIAQAVESGMRKRPATELLKHLIDTDRVFLHAVPGNKKLRGWASTTDPDAASKMMANLASGKAKKLSDQV